MKGKSLLASGALALAVAALPLSANADTQVILNGQQLNTPVAPMQMNYRTLVPMRSIFEALGANVRWDDYSQTIFATRGNENIRMQIGNAQAVVNGQNVTLDQQPVLYNGYTMVPLRFVAESLGADVGWNDALQQVNITTHGDWHQHQAVAGYRGITIPMDTVVPVTLDNQLSSGWSHVGDAFTATIRSQRMGDSEFPPGTKLSGIVTESEPRQGDQPGILNVEFQSAILPDGSTVPLQGHLTSLDDNNVTTNGQGRIIAKNHGDNGKFAAIGIGAGAGYVLGRALHQNGGLSAILGAAGGYLFDRSRNNNNASEAVLPAGTTLGAQLDGNVTYADTTNYWQHRDAFH